MKTFFENTNDLDGVEKVVWRKKVYNVGNRRNELTGLYQDGILTRIVNICSCKPYNK